MAEYAELVNALRCCAKLNSLSLFKRDLMKQAAETIERLSAEMCPHYIRNIHDRGDDSLCKKAGCEVKAVQPVVRCKDCRHRDPEDHKCDCGGLERAGCVFRVSDDYFCAYGER